MKPWTTCCPWLHKAFIVLPLLVSISLDYNYKVRAASRQRGLLIIAELNQFHTVPVYLYVASHVTDTMKSHAIMNAEYSLKKLLPFAI